MLKNLSIVQTRLYLGFAAKSLLVGLGVSIQESGVRSQEIIFICSSHTLHPTPHTPHPTPHLPTPANPLIPYSKA
ncbi:hypothetical protein [Microcystis aeruginosa]|uniref:hypothetical protein n=1 Tax=Microcystis aeruginosa TaxID=1126 RepID=UPI0013309EAA|nr:hypothetical protein [Microcystis aeruginosa]